VDDSNRHRGRTLQARGHFSKLKRAPGQSLSPPASDRSYGPPAPGVGPLWAYPAQRAGYGRSRHHAMTGTGKKWANQLRRCLVGSVDAIRTECKIFIRICKAVLR